MTFFLNHLLSKYEADISTESYETEKNPWIQRADENPVGAGYLETEACQGSKETHRE